MTYEMDIAGLKRELPLCKVTDDLYIGAFVMFGDVELTVHCAAELLKRHFAAVGLDRLIAAPAQIDDDKTSDVGLVFQNQNFLHIGFLPSNDGAGAPVCINHMKSAADRVLVGLAVKYFGGVHRRAFLLQKEAVI